MADLQPHPFKVIIVGAGLSGSLLANGLLHSNINLTLHERDRADTKREGYQIRLGGPVLEGMRACLQKPDLERIVSKFGMAAGRKAVAPNILDREFRPLIHLNAFKAYSRSAAISRVVLRDEMMKQIPEDRVEYERKFEGMEIVQRDERERVEVYFEGGFEDEADVIIGAYGNRSKINQQLGLSNITPLSTHYSFISKADVSIDDLATSRPNSSTAPTSPSAMTCHSTSPPTFPTWTHLRPPRKTGSCMFGLYVPVHLVPGDPSALSASEKLDILRLAMRDWAPRYHQMLDIVSDTDPYIYTAHVSQRPPVDWRARARKSHPTDPIKGHPRIWLMSDAVHAMPPYRGMGGNQSMLDAAKMLPYPQDLANASELKVPLTLKLKRPKRITR